MQLKPNSNVSKQGVLSVGVQVRAVKKAPRFIHFFTRSCRFLLC
jgi:hypothetical protein